jgi:hypothetical protein
VGTVSSGGLFTAGTAAGTHTIVATSVADATQSGSAIVAVTDLAGVYTYHNDLARDGVNGREYALTTANVNTAGFAKLFSCTADGAIYGQPLWVANLTVNSARHNVVFVATQHDSLFAFDVDGSACVTLWSVSLIDTTHGGAAGETTVPSGQANHLVGGGAGDISPEVGVTGTPVIDPATGTLYIVSKSVDASQTTFYQRLHAIDLTSGKERIGSPVTIAGTVAGTGAHNGTNKVVFDARQENQRCGLALVNGVVYLAWAGHEDVPPYYGWIMGYSYNGTAFTQASILNVTPNAGQGGIWMSGGAIAADSTSLYAITGNGGFDASSPTAPNNDYGDSLLQLTSTLTVTHYFTPSDQALDNSQDQDFGAGGAVVLADLPAGPKRHLILGGGKDGTVFVLDRDNLGGAQALSANNPSAVQQVLMNNEIFATGAFWSNTFYIAAVGSTLNSYSLNPMVPQFALASHSAATYRFPGGTPSVSAAGTQNGIVWILDTSAYCTLQTTNGCGPAVLHAYDATDLTKELWSSAMAAAGTDAAGHAVKFAVPTIANGKVYVGTRGNNAGGTLGSTTISGELDVYGLK